MTKESGRKLFAGIALILLAVILISVFYLFGISKNSVDLTFAFVVGISMIVLPCTLPLVFIIVPLSMGKGYKKGLAIALLFGLGLAITLSLYGIFIGFLGNILGLENAVVQAKTFSRVLFMIGCGIALLFGLSELGLIKFELPSYAGTPKFIEKRKDYAKMVCSDCKSINYFIHKARPKAEGEIKLELKKFCKGCRKHVLHTEGKK